MAQKEPSLVQNNLLASRLVGSNSDLSKAARPDSKLYSLVQNNLLVSRLVDSNSKLLKAARPDSKLCNIAKY